MPHRHSLPAYDGMLPRPRLQSLVRQGMQHPLLVILAGPGYGKTQTIANYLEKSDARILWLRLSSLDNLYSHLWNHLLRALKPEFPELSQRLQALEIPDTAATLDAFMQLLEQELSGTSPIIWVFDDFGEITDPEIRKFTRILVETELNNFHLVLISNDLTHPESIAFLADKRFLIMGRDLRFTKSEISELYTTHNIPLDEDELNEICHSTEGWPLPLHLLVLQRSQIQIPVLHNGELNQNTVFYLFEERFYSAYSQKLQKLVIKLSLLNSFTAELAFSLYEGDRADLQGMANHAFLNTEPATGQFFLHNLYHRFLQQKQYLLTEEERQQVWRAAAEHFSKNGNYMSAIGYYHKCGDHAGMLNTMCDYAKTQLGYSTYGIMPKDAVYLLEHLDFLTPQEVREYPVADYLRALIYLNTMELEKSEKLFLNLEQRLLASGTPEALELLGDTYYMIATLHMMCSQPDFDVYFEKASGYLPNGTRLQNRNSFFTQNNNSFSIPDNLPGTKERVESAVHRGVPWATKMLGGGMSGMEHIYSSEAAYLSGRFDEARQYAYRCIYKAEPHAQHDLVCNGYCLLARIGFMQGDFAETSEQLLNIELYASKHESGVLRDIRNTAWGWYYVKMRDFKRVPKSILTLSLSDKPALAHDRSIIVYANYLVSTGDFARLVGMLEYPVGLYLTSCIRQDSILLNILLAVGYYHLGNHSDALKMLWKAYDMTHSNGLTTPFIECEDHMLALADLARGQSVYAFDPDWLQTIRDETMAYIKRAQRARSAYKMENPAKTAKNSPLTPRETDILLALSMGQTREEIAAEQYISLNTVKTFIRNIYTKLNAANRAEAVSIAISRGYINTPTL